MRAPAALAVLVTNALVNYSSAQAAGYGSPNGNNGASPGGGGNGAGSSNGPNGLPDNNVYGNAGGLPNANPQVNNGDFPGGNPGGSPGGVPPGGVPTGMSGALPLAAPGASTCATSGDPATVFVTVLPTASLRPSGFPQPNGAGPDESVHQTLNPATTALVSPVQSLQGTQSLVPAFTTLTIDVWGNGLNSGDASGAVASATQPAVYSNPAHSLASQSVPDPNQAASSVRGDATNGPSHGTADGPAPAATPYGDAGGSPSGPGSPSSASAPGSLPFVVVTDTNVQWVPGAQGPTQVTVLSPHTLTFGPATVASFGPDGSAPRLTFTGPDGKPTVVAYPGGLPVNGGGSAQAITTGAVLPTAVAPGPVTTCTSYTVLGPNGIPTVVQSTWVVDPATSAHPVLPSGISSFTAANPTMPNAPGSTTCTSYTVLGPDGRPTVVQSTWLLPLPVNSQSALAATSAVPFPTISGPTSQIISGLGLPPGVGPVIPGANGGVTTCTKYTVLGPDGLPTIVDSTWVIPTASATNVAAPPNAITGAPNQISGFSGSPPLPSGIVPGANGITTCATYTVLGPNGLPTVIESTWVIPLSGPTNTATANAVTGIPPLTGLPGFPSQLGGPAPGANGVTTCTSWTALGPDGLPTVVESTFVIPASNALPAATNPGFPSAVTQGNNGLPQGLSPITPGSGVATTCLTVGVVGPDGRTTPVVQTVALTPGAANGLPTGTAVGFPPLVPQQNQLTLSNGASQAGSANQPVTSCITVNVLGANGIVTPVVQTVIVSPSGPSLGLPTAPVLSGVPSLPQSVPGGLPGLGSYGAPAGGPQSILPPSAVVSGIVANPQTPLPPAIPAAPSVLNGPGGSSPLPPSYNDPLANGPPFQVSQSGLGSFTTQAGGIPTSVAYGQLPVAPNGARLVTVLQTSTWTNVIPEQTTTYTLNFPLTTMATVTVPVSFSPYKRGLRRQESSLASGNNWGNSSSAATDAFSQNTSLGASISSALGSPSISPSLPPAPSSGPTQTLATAGASAAPTMCASGGKIGNSTLNFDGTKPGPLFNPSQDIWFSEGFVIVPPTSQTSQSYTPSSGGQLVEFVPPSLSSVSTSGSRDTAEIGVGPNRASSCFRFDFHGANLGCAAQGNEQWCDFEISAYTFNQSSTKEQSIAWSETKRVPACPSFPNGGCQLTPVQLDGYTNITSVLIKLHVGLDLRTWWGDDFRLGWTDNSCEAARCRANALPHRVKRETIENAAQQGVWHWTPAGLERLDDEYIWQSLH